MLLLSLYALVPIIAAIGVKAGPCPGTKQEPGSRGSFAAFPNGQPHWGGPDPNFNGGVRVSSMKPVATIDRLDIPFLTLYVMAMNGWY
jgi:hypothetical protein